MTPTAGDERPADDHDRDGRQKIFVAHAKAGLAVEAGEKHADDGRTEPAEDVDPDERRADVDAREEGDARTVADGIDAPAEPVPSEQDGRANDEQRQDPNDRRDAEQAARHQPTQRRGGEAGGVPLL